MTDTERHGGRQPRVSGDRVVWSGSTCSPGRPSRDQHSSPLPALGLRPGDSLLGSEGVHFISSAGGQFDIGSDTDNEQVFSWTPANRVVQLTDSPFQERFPQVSGNRIVWVRYVGSKTDIFTMVVDLPPTNP